MKRKAKKSSQVVNVISLAGLDYLTAEDAALYCRVSLSQFYEKRDEYGIAPFPFMSKRLYRKADVKIIIEKEAEKWRQSEKKAVPGICAGTRTANKKKNPSVKSQSATLN